MTLQLAANQQGAPELIIVGAGLAAAILALRLSHGRGPRPRILILEQDSAPFGDKTWSMQATDTNQYDREWLSKAIFAEWPSQSVQFEALNRVLDTGYASINSSTLRHAVGGLDNVEMRTDTSVTKVMSDAVHLATGEIVTAPCVLDARGHAPNAGMDLAYQKFVGWTVDTVAPHGVEAPVIMDGTVEQIDGFRFVYLLPFSETRILIEDTRYADGAALDEASIEATIKSYAAEKGWEIKEIVHREAGVLPIALAYDRRKFRANAGACPSVGMRAGLFHSTTGYSLPDAIRVANLVADAWPLNSDALAAMLRRHARKRARVQMFYRFLNRMLFKAAEPHRRHLVMQKFYRLPRETIERFYAGRTTLFDVLRILSGEPPVPILRALPCILEPPIKGAVK
ncbi:MAG: lycopene beta-cyclase CrtY [Pseudomonadota bacterium]